MQSNQSPRIFKYLKGYNKLNLEFNWLCISTIQITKKIFDKIVIMFISNYKPSNDSKGFQFANIKIVLIVYTRPYVKIF